MSSKRYYNALSNAVKIEYDIKKLLKEKTKYKKEESTFIVQNVVNVKFCGHLDEIIFVNMNIFKDINELKVRILSFDRDTLCIDILPNNDIEFISKINDDFKIIDYEEKLSSSYDEDMIFLNYHDVKYWPLTMEMRGYRTNHYIIDHFRKSEEPIVEYNKNNIDVCEICDLYYKHPEYIYKYKLVLWSTGKEFIKDDKFINELKKLKLKKNLKTIKDNKKEILIYDDGNDRIEYSYVLIEHNENESHIDTYDSSFMTKYIYGGKLFTIIRCLSVNIDPKKGQGSDSFYNTGFTIYSKVGTFSKGLVLFGDDGLITGWKSASNQGYFVPDLICNCENTKINVYKPKTFLIKDDFYN